MMVLRVVSGMKDHFKLRLPEWGFAGMMMAYGSTLIWNHNHNINTFLLSTGYATMASLAPAVVWGWAICVVSGVRLLALILNGTFGWFKSISPIVRSITSGLSAFVWALIAVGIWFADTRYPGIWIFGGLAALDGVLGYFVSGESGAAVRAHRDELARRRE